MSRETTGSEATGPNNCGYTGRVPAQVLAGAVLAEAHDEWQVSERRYLSEGSMALPATPPADPKGGSHTSTTHGIVSASPLTRSR
jgi:hypothetical protein